ncbi:zinc ribbon domain-containing protein [Lactobacillus sp. LL6]|uniref:zinc ribbon domain-containing protein n=1 Tax=Lactobacillus sp. LL6 TaxID=2596827 RepID=UPI0011860B12|nr:zinc ribbon domain-containing protein [Lactobacillus sp. LL6]TSO26147.1 zinc ribbon domain-containing protein [Lactobacillus sp. LL6]
MVESNITANENDKFSVSLLAFWVKGVLKVDSRFVHIDLPNTVLWGLIPAGKNMQNVPLTGITNVAVSNSYKLGAMFLGIVLAFLGFGMFSSSFLGGLIILLIGVLCFLSGIKTSLTFEKSGIMQTIAVPFFESTKIRDFANQINNSIAQRQDDTNVRMNTDRQINATQMSSQVIADAIRSQNTAAPVTNSVANNVQAGNTKFCSNCGNKVTTDSKFCTNCGAKLN